MLGNVECKPRSTSLLETHTVQMYYYLKQAYALAVTNSTDIHIGNPAMQYILAAAPDAEYALEQSHTIFMCEFGFCA